MNDSAFTAFAAFQEGSRNVPIWLNADFAFKSFGEFRLNTAEIILLISKFSSWNVLEKIKSLNIRMF